MLRMFEKQDIIRMKHYEKVRDLLIEKDIDYTVVRNVRTNQRKCGDIYQTINYPYPMVIFYHNLSNKKFHKILVEAGIAKQQNIN